MSNSKTKTSQKTNQLDRIKQLEKQVYQLKLVRNPMLEEVLPIDDGTKISLYETLKKANDVLTYLMLNNRNDEGLDVAPDAREWISECALNAIEFVQDNLDDIEVQL